jgi:Nuclease-related domain
MYPRELLPDEVKSRAEEKVFAHLRDELPAPWQVFHSASWIARDPKRGASNGEIDFVLLHEDHPLVCIEVKGGGIE